MLDIAYHHADYIIITNFGNRLWIGDVSAAEDVAWLKDKNIRTGNIFLRLVITAATGFNFKYDPSIRQIKYDLKDKNSEKISDYFDMAAYQIDKSILPSIQICGLEAF